MVFIAELARSFQQLVGEVEHVDEGIDFGHRSYQWYAESRRQLLGRRPQANGQPQSEDPRSLAPSIFQYDQVMRELDQGRYLRLISIEIRGE